MCAPALLLNSFAARRGDSMDVNITAVSANRKLGKALGRTPAFRRRLTELVEPLTHPDWSILQVVINDRPSSFVEVGSQVGQGGLLQVRVGVPDGLTFAQVDDAPFVDGCARQLARALVAVPTTDALRAEILMCIEQARVEKRGESIPYSPLSMRRSQ